VFFSLWPTDAVRGRIESLTRPWVERSGGIAIPPINFHVTLAFLGAVSEASLERARVAGASLRGSPFEFVLDGIESWATADVLCLTTARPTPTVSSLASRLRFSLLAQQVDSSSQEFRPHVSLARGVSATVDAPIGPVIWPVSGFVLVESSTGSRGSDYRIIERYTLNGETV
jgi:2'-5' RNA ligase